MVSSCMPSGIIRTNIKWNIHSVGTKNDDTQHNFGPRHRGTKFVQPITDIPDHDSLIFHYQWILETHSYSMNIQILRLILYFGPF